MMLSTGDRLNTQMHAPPPKTSPQRIVLLDATLLQFGRWFADQPTLWRGLPRLRSLAPLIFKPSRGLKDESDVVLFNVAYLWIALISVCDDEELVTFSRATTEERAQIVEFAFARLLRIANDPHLNDAHAANTRSPSAVDQNGSFETRTAG